MSDQKFKQLTAEDFKEKFDKLAADKNNYGDVIEMLAAAIHSEKVQKIVNDKYLEYRGYDLEELSERGRDFINGLLEENRETNE